MCGMERNFSVAFGKILCFSSASILRSSGPGAATTNGIQPTNTTSAMLHGNTERTSLSGIPQGILANMDQLNSIHARTQALLEEEDSFDESDEGSSQLSGLSMEYEESEFDPTERYGDDGGAHEDNSSANVQAVPNT